MLIKSDTQLDCSVVTAASSELNSVGSTFLSLKLVVRRPQQNAEATNDVVYMGMTQHRSLSYTICCYCYHDIIIILLI